MCARLYWLRLESLRVRCLAGLFGEGLALGFLGVLWWLIVMSGLLWARRAGCGGA